MTRTPIMMRVDEAKALSDELRVFILDLLSKKPMSVHEIAEELKKKGLYKNINTIRYHLQVLKEAGLITLVATREVKGGVLKYYAARKTIYSYEVTEDIERLLEPIISSLYERLRDIVLNVLQSHDDLILEISKKLKPCPYCITRDFAEYVILEALRIAAGRVIYDDRVKAELGRFKVEGENVYSDNHH